MKEIIDRACDIECVTEADAKAVAALADLAVQLQSRLESMENEMQEQCRIIGMSAERELSLISKIESLEKDAAQGRANVLAAQGTS